MHGHGLARIHPAGAMSISLLIEHAVIRSDLHSVTHKQMHAEGLSNTDRYVCTNHVQWLFCAPSSAGWKAHGRSQCSTQHNVSSQHAPP